MHMHKRDEKCTMMINDDFKIPDMFQIFDRVVPRRPLNLWDDPPKSAKSNNTSN